MVGASLLNLQNSISKLRSIYYPASFSNFNMTASNSATGGKLNIIPLHPPFVVLSIKLQLCLYNIISICLLLASVSGPPFPHRLLRRLCEVSFSLSMKLGAMKSNPVLYLLSTHHSKASLVVRAEMPPFSCCLLMLRLCNSPRQSSEQCGVPFRHHNDIIRVYLKYIYELGNKKRRESSLGKCNAHMTQLFLSFYLAPNVVSSGVTLCSPRI